MTVGAHCLIEITLLWVEGRDANATRLESVFQHCVKENHSFKY